MNHNIFIVITVLYLDFLVLLLLRFKIVCLDPRGSYIIQHL